MEQNTQFFLRFEPDTLSITGMGKNIYDMDGNIILPVLSWDLVEPFFSLEKHLINYYPVIENGIVVGLKPTQKFELSIVPNPEDDILRSLRITENAIASCDIKIQKLDKTVILYYDPEQFDTITNQENIDRLTLVKDFMYNMYITKKGDPFQVYASQRASLSPLLEGKPIILNYTGDSDISIYIVGK